MTTLPAALKTLLAADAALTASQPGGLGFTVWDRWLVKTGPGATPEAFDDARGGRLKRSAVVLDGGQTPHWMGSFGSDGKRWTGTPTVTLFAEATASGRAALDAAVLRVEDILRAGPLATDAGPVDVVYDGRVPIIDSDQFPGNVVAVARVAATWARWYG